MTDILPNFSSMECAALAVSVFLLVVMSAAMVFAGHINRLGARLVEGEGVSRFFPVGDTPTTKTSPAG